MYIFNAFVVINMATFPFFSLGDNALNNVLNEQHNYPLSVIDNMVYDPFSLIDDKNSVDEYILNTVQVTNCKYFCVGSAEKVNLPSPGLNIMFHNISSVPLHLESLTEQCLNPFHVKFDALCLCETRLNYDICPLYNITNYNAFLKN